MARKETKQMSGTQSGWHVVAITTAQGVAGWTCVLDRIEGWPAGKPPEGVVSCGKLHTTTRAAFLHRDDLEVKKILGERGRRDKS